MPSKLLCDPYIWESPKVIFYTAIFPTDYTRCVSDRLNHVMLVFALFMAAGYAAKWKLGSPIPVIIATLLAILVCLQSIFIIWGLMTKSKSEGFRSGSADFTGNVDIIGKKNAGIASLPAESIGVSEKAYDYTLNPTQPTARNPFMNVLVDELKYNPTRPAANSVLDPIVKLSLDEFFKTEFYADPTDVFGRSQGQRQWTTMPSTSIPNDMDSYQNWLYRIPGKTCKEAGGAACLPGTDGAAMPWLNYDSTTLGSDAINALIVNRYPKPYVGSGSTK